MSLGELLRFLGEFRRHFLKGDRPPSIFSFGIALRRQDGGNHPIPPLRQIMLTQPERLADQPLEAVPSDGVAELPSNRQPEPAPSKSVRQAMQNYTHAARGVFRLEDRVKFSGVGQPLEAGEAEPGIGIRGFIHRTSPPSFRRRPPQAVSTLR